MLVNETELNSRLNNPLNLINRLSIASSARREKNGMSLFIPSAAQRQTVSRSERTEPLPSVQFSSPISKTSTVVEPTTEELVKDSEDKIKLALAHDDALSLLQNSITALRIKIDDVKPEKLPAVISAASKVVESIRAERLERSRNNDNDNIHFHFYVPVQKNISEYEIINVTER